MSSKHCQFSRKGVAVVVAEDDGDWSVWARRLGASAHKVIPLIQEPGESPMGLALRVRSLLHRLEHECALVVSAAIAGGGRTDADAMAARAVVIRALSSAMTKAGGGRVILDGGRERYGMQALSNTVSGMVRGTGVEVVSAPAPTRPHGRRSGTRRAPSAA